MFIKYFFVIFCALSVVLINTVDAKIRCGDRFSYGHDDNDQVSPNYDYVDVNVTYYYENGEKVGIKNIYCYGNACTPCPECNLVRVDQDPLDQEFLDNSANTMNSFVVEQLNLGNLSGIHSFNTFYNGLTVYRNVTWTKTINQGLTDFHIRMNVITNDISN